MLVNDIELVQSFLIQVEDLPDEIIQDEDFSYLKFLGDEEQTKIEQNKYYVKRNKIFKNLDDLLIEVRAYIKIKFGIESEYWLGFNQISFDSSSQGILMGNFNTNHNKYWYAGKRDLFSLLKNIEAEIKMSNMPSPNLISKYKEREERKLKTTANILFFLILFSFLIVVSFFLFKGLINWETLKWSNPQTWINEVVFGKVEFLTTLFEVFFVGGSIFIWKKFRIPFSELFYEKFKLKN